MTQSRRFLMVIAICSAAAGAVAPPPARAATWQPVALSDSLGPEIDSAERTEYHLLPDVSGFISARFFVRNGSGYRLQYSYEKAGGIHERSVGLSAEAWELTRQHVALVDQYRAVSAAPDSGGPPEWQYRLALKFAAETRYEVSRPLLQDIAVDYPGSLAAEEAGPTLATVDRLAGAKHGLYLPGEIHDQSGRTHLLLFAGYYGIWVGVAIPLWAESDSPQAYAAGLLIAAPTSLLLANALSKNSDMSEGKAWMISLGGNLGTWQGIGWSALGDTDGNQVVGIGLLSGLAGIAGAVALTNRVYFTEGHAAVTNASLFWGAWFGVVAAVVGGAEDDAVLRASLIGTDALVLGSGIAARNVRMSSERMRLINLLGVVGTAVGFGFDLLFEVDGDGAVLGIAGAGSILGLMTGIHATRIYDQGKNLAAAPERGAPGPTIAPQVTLSREGAARPMFGLRASF